MLFLMIRKSWTSFADTSTTQDTYFPTFMKKHSFELIWNSEVKPSPRCAGRGLDYSIWYWLLLLARKLTVILMQRDAPKSQIFTIKGHSASVKSKSCEEQALKSVSSIFYNLSLLSVNHVGTIADRGRLRLVQYLLLMGQYLQGTQKSVEAWAVHGLAVKAAFQLGLHSSEASKAFSPLDREIRKRTWFGCVVLDRYVYLCF
jgi:hypothetical protein